MIFLGFLYLLMTVASLILWFIDLQICTTEACSFVPGLLMRSWYLWGAVYYAIAGAQVIVFRKNKITGLILISGAVFHVGLIFYNYIKTGQVCPICWKFAAAGTLLTTAYWILKDSKAQWATWISSGTAIALSMATCTLLIMNPVTVRHLNTVQIVQASEHRVSEPLDGSLKLTVLNPDRTETVLNLRNKPALFFSVWCSHCDDALLSIAQLEHKKRPYLVVTYFREEDLEKVKNKLFVNSLVGEAYYLITKPPMEIQGVPSLMWWDEGLKHLEGTAVIKAHLQ